MGESRYPPIEMGGFIAPPHPLFFVNVAGWGSWTSWRSGAGRVSRVAAVLPGRREAPLPDTPFQSLGLALGIKVDAAAILYVGQRPTLCHQPAVNFGAAHAAHRHHPPVAVGVPPLATHGALP